MKQPSKIFYVAHTAPELHYALTELGWMNYDTLIREFFPPIESILEDLFEIEEDFRKTAVKAKLL